MCMKGAAPRDHPPKKTQTRSIKALTRDVYATSPLAAASVWVIQSADTSQCVALTLAVKHQDYSSRPSEVGHSGNHYLELPPPPPFHLLQECDDKSTCSISSWLRVWVCFLR